MRGPPDPGVLGAAGVRGRCNSRAWRNRRSEFFASSVCQLLNNESWTECQTLQQDFINHLYTPYHTSKTFKVGARHSNYSVTNFLITFQNVTNKPLDVILFIEECRPNFWIHSSLTCHCDKIGQFFEVIVGIRLRREIVIIIVLMN